MITLREFLKLCAERELYMHRSWRIQAMLITENPKREPYYVIQEDKKWGFLNGQGEFVAISDAGKTDKPLLTWKTWLTLESGDLANVKEKTKCIYGQWLLNACAFAHYYKDAVPFLNRPVTPKDMHAVYYQLKRDKKTDAETLLKSWTVAETLLASDCELGVPAADRAMFGEDAAIEAEKKRLLKEYGDRIQDPVIQAEFDKKMGDLYKAKANATDSRDFYGDRGKIFGVVIAKTDNRFGAEASIDGKPTEFVAKPLREGWDTERMDSWVNSARAGSYSRGGLTAESGYGVKKGMGAYGGLIVTDVEDCKTKKGLVVIPTAKNYFMYRGMYVLGKEDKGLLEEEDLKKLVGKKVTLRVPGTCASEAGSYCRRCMGGATNPNAIASGVTSIDSTLMNVRMKAQHGTVLKSVKVDLIANFS